MTKVLPAFLLLLLTACTSPPDGLQPVASFDVERYLGQWYEIARLDHKFERGLTDVSANYARREDGGIRVVNRGYDPTKQQWQEAVGKAYLTGPADVGQLKVSFFGPFYGGYTVLALDSNYEWAVVCGPSRNYFWILARAPKMAPALYLQLVAQAKEWGFPVEELIRVEHGREKSR